ncbi:MAG TPA: choice-of-anchor tandem repeat GloVer-containing protein, partial [Rhizomicrobium sp.]|nr:choice-of-anchor tandem repeat GloVer-containing protein [Rhizomicrobium sp.]
MLAFGLCISAPAFSSGQWQEDKIKELKTSEAGFVAARPDSFGNVYYILRGTSGNCGGLFRISQGDKHAKLLDQFIDTGSGCIPTSLSIVDDPTVKPTVFVTIQGGQTVAFDTAFNSISTVAVPGAAVGASISSATHPRAQAPTIANDVYITASNSSDGPSGAIYHATIDDHGQISTPQLIFAFPGGANGANPTSGVVVGPDGDLYGVTQNGGSTKATLCQAAHGVNGCGVVYRLIPTTSGGVTTWHEEVLYAFKGGADGSEPNSEIALDTNGNLYGTTFLGGDLKRTSAKACVGAEFHTVFGCGTVFMLTHAASAPWSETVLHTFHGGPDGAQPFGAITIDGLGNIFGTTVAGGHV